MFKYCTDRPAHWPAESRTAAFEWICLGIQSSSATQYRAFHIFPIRVMHRFYNIGKDMLRVWCGGGVERYVLGRSAIREIDAELQSFG